MPFFQKIPVIVQAEQFVYPITDDLRAFLGADTIGQVKKEGYIGAKAEMEIRTLEDGKHLKVKHIATEGDWIIKGVNGECWAVKPDIFALTYQPLIKGQNQ